MQYAVIIEHGPESYGAYSPDVPGCVAVGTTVEEVTQRFREALTDHLALLREAGEPLPTPTTQIVYIDAA
jgi:predicted RNase H-like HicB family nuclease